MRKRVREIGFDVDAYTARLIGRENVSKLEGAVFEIVKNAYDADASVCCLYFIQKEFLYYKKWKNTDRSKGNWPVCLDRMSDQCDMLTISDEGSLEWIVDWRNFDGNKRISEVKARVYDTDIRLLEHVTVLEIIWRICYLQM